MKSVIKWIDVNFEPLLMVLLFFAMILLVTMQVCLRIVGKGFNWGEEMSRLLFVWLSYISFGYLTRNNRHVRMAFARDLLPEKGQRIVMIVCDLLFLVFVVFGFKAAVIVCGQVNEFGDRLVTIHATANVLYAAGLVGFLLMAVRGIQSLVWKLMHFKAAFEIFANENGEHYPQNRPCFIPKARKALDGECDAKAHIKEGG
ncbi:TRAP transporter small permease [Clostridium sp. AM58-1XD]|uniref:TRAP transporter small permease n=1 Tax=Clostridium sp. AM58-1XD TaxID=2292307 RepID=UPI0015F3F7C7|nr:TRAP transporter small permease [Clostridium sp. AM58-1XD]